MQIAEVFEVAQKRTNQKNTKSLIKILKDSDTLEFSDEFLRNLSLFMPAKSKNTEVRRLIKLTSDFIEAIDSEEYFEFSDIILNALVFGTSSKEKQVRVHCITLAVSILKHLQSIEPEVYKKIKNKFQKSLTDNESNVRVSAVEGCCVLLKTDEGENILERLLDMLQCDPSAEVRKKLLEELPLSDVTMPFIFGRIRDIDENVRRAVLKKISDEVHNFQQIPSVWRTKILTFGFTDRSKTVLKEAEMLLINKWLPSIELNFLKFVLDSGLRNIDVLKKILTCVLNAFQDTKFVFDDEFWFNISFESVLMLESYLTILKDRNDDVTECLPQLTNFVDILRECNSCLFRFEDVLKV
eukprot:NODE_586_length_5672_cov_0.462229.p3 type:complete len:354 gc:universal NODE_586_length_5672_cov_0.462229:2279-3340(+)